MNNLHLLEPYNLFFVCSMALALIMLLVSMLGGMGGEHDVSIEHDIDMDADMDTDVDADDSIPHDFSHNIEGENSLLNTMMSGLGIGKVPVSILMFLWFFIFGFTGLLLNGIWMSLFATISIMVLASAGVAFLVSLVVSSFLARVIGKFMPSTESYGEKLTDFINREAEVRFTVTSDSGTVVLYDKHKNMQTLQARRDPSCKENILPDTKVIIVSYQKEKEEFIVLPSKQLSQTL